MSIKHIARLTSKKEKRCTGRKLLKALRKVELSAEEFRAWHQDLSAARKTLSAQHDKWR